MEHEHPARPPLVLAVDLGGTKILAAVVGANGAILGRVKRPTSRTLGPEAVTERIVETIHEALGAAGRSLNDVAAVGVGSPGPLDPDSGMILTTPNLGWENFPLGARLSAMLERPVYIDNDVKLGTLAEVRQGAGRGAQSVVGIFVGTGIGGAVILDGQIHHGASKNAGEIGHHVVVARGPRCGCGVRGCLEAVASRTAIEKTLRRELKQGKKSSLKVSRKQDQITSGDLLRAYTDGDKLARKLIHRSADYVGIGIANMLNILSPERVVLGGGVVEAFGDAFLERARRSARKHCFSISSRASEVVAAQLGDDAGVLGAAAMARDRISTDSRAARSAVG